MKKLEEYLIINQAKNEHGRPWIDGMVEDLRTLGFRSWRTMAKVRNEHNN
jgi:hypothetical protein